MGNIKACFRGASHSTPPYHFSNAGEHSYEIAEQTTPPASLELVLVLLLVQQDERPLIFSRSHPRGHRRRREILLTNDSLHQECSLKLAALFNGYILCTLDDPDDPETVLRRWATSRHLLASPALERGRR